MFNILSKEQIKSNRQNVESINQDHFFFSLTLILILEDVYNKVDGKGHLVLNAFGRMVS